MIIERDKIIIFKEEDKELYNLICKISVTDFGVLKFENKEIKEIKTRYGKPYQVITIEKSSLLNEE